MESAKEIVQIHILGQEARLTPIGKDKNHYPEEKLIMLKDFEIEKLFVELSIPDEGRKLIRFARMNDTAAIARKMNITKGEAGRMRWECRKGYVWLD